MYRIVLLSASLLLPAAAGAALEPAQEGNAFTYVNALRMLAGMGPLGSDAQLDTAARAHASYLERNSYSGGHYQNPSDPGYTGVTAGDRAEAAGYSSTYVLENVSGGQDDAYDSVDGLMGAIYHRFGFLDFSIDQIGIGITGGDYGRYVYNMGNAGLEAACSESGFSGSGSYYVACAGDGRVDASAYDGALAAVRDANPARVAWPSDGNGDIPPAFFEESPDPLPDYGVSGYPVSLSFNEAKVSSVQLLELALRRADDGARLTNVRLLDENSDPNGKFSDKDFALFPLDRLAWDTRYRADADLVVDGRRKFVRWSFQTRDLGMRVFTLNGNGDGVSVGSGSRFALYLPPRSANDTLGSLRWSYTGGTTVDASFHDGNTLIVTASGPAGGSASFTAGDRSFSVTLDAGAALGATGGNSHESGCVGGVELAHFDPVTGVLRLPVVNVSGTLYEVSLRQQGGYDFAVDTARPASGAGAACAAASFDSASGVLDIPVVKVAAGTAAATGYRVRFARQSGVEGIRFSLSSATAE